MTDDGLVYQALSVHFCRAKLITHFDGQYAVAKYSKSIWRRCGGGASSGCVNVYIV